MTVDSYLGFQTICFTEREAHLSSVNCHLSTSLLFDLIQHLQRCLDSGFCLVGIEATGLEIYSGIIPADDRLNESVGTTGGMDTE